MVLAAGWQFKEAIAALRGVAEVADPRFEQFAAQAQGEIARLEAQRSELRAASDRALPAARQLLEVHAYENAQRAIEQVPEPLRSDEHNEVLDRARACREEVLALSVKIRETVEQKQSGNLLPKLDRLLALKPNHEQARQLATRLAANLAKAGKARLSQHKYREALDALDQIPGFLRDDDVNSLIETAGELESLLQAVCGGALADQALLELAERLCKLAPGNTEAAQLRSELIQQVKVKPDDRRLAAANWASLPKRTSLGVPVDWLGHATRPARANQGVAESLASHPGQFFTAFGLALQGLGLAAIEANLTPREKSRVLSKLSSFSNLSFGGRKAIGAWGVDLGDYALKAVKLTRGGAPEDVQIEAAEYILHSQPLTHQGPGIEPGKIADQTLRDFVARTGDLKGTKLCVGMPGQKVLGRFFDLPPMPAKKAPDAILYEAQHQLPIALEELCWSHHLADESASKEGEAQPRRVLLQAAREAHVRERVALFKAAGLSVDAVQSDCMALHNALLHEFFEDTAPGGAASAIAAVEIGAESTNIVVSSPAGAWFRTVSQGGDSFTRELVKQFKLTHQQAEELKRRPAKARRYNKLEQAIQPLLFQLAGEVERSLATYARLFPAHPVNRMYGLGGGFQMHGVLSHLRSRR